MTWRLEVGRIDSPEGARLAQAHLDEMERRYGEEDEWDGLAPEQLAAPHGTFLIAWIDDTPVGCGGLRRIDDTTGEVKRMYVADDARRRGIARGVLEEIEATARRIGYCLARCCTLTI